MLDNQHAREARLLLKLSTLVIVLGLLIIILNHI
jgi:hypothetical protein